MRRKMIMKKYLSLLFYGLTITYGLKCQGQEVLFSTLDAVRKPAPLDPNLSSITNTGELIIMDDFKLSKKSQITQFTFIGQLGKPTPENIALIKGVRLYILRAFTTSQPLSEATSLNYFELIREYTPGLKITQQGDQVTIGIDIKSLGFDMILEAGTYGIAFAPIIATEEMPPDKVWYWYQGTDYGAEAVIWDNGGWSSTSFGSVAFSIEGKEVTLGISKSDIQTVTAKVSPNPSYDVFKISTPKEIVSVVVYNGNGQLVLQNKSKTIDLSAFPKGIYWITVICNDGGQLREKLIKT
ncbi:T9SS type A sorting domain-containing protein [Flavobacterium sp. CAU 1735]|uniref:T9SS type A sorting domain-containing protein n=1 Tax=Flavobacterium sp. CAU 1735 TaxID=3140361 RepID=UPI00325FE404